MHQSTQSLTRIALLTDTNALTLTLKPYVPMPHRLCVASCPNKAETKRRCIDISFLATSCPTSEPPAFHAVRNGGNCPPPSTSIAWGRTASVNAWPNNRDDGHCSNGDVPAVWDARGKWDTLDECRKYVEALEAAKLFSRTSARSLRRHLSVEGAARQDWGVSELSRGISADLRRSRPISAPPRGGQAAVRGRHANVKQRECAAAARGDPRHDVVPHLCTGAAVKRRCSRQRPQRGVRPTAIRRALGSRAPIWFLWVWVPGR